MDYELLEFGGESVHLMPNLTSIDEVNEVIGWRSLIARKYLLAAKFRFLALIEEGLSLYGLSPSLEAWAKQKVENGGRVYQSRWAIILKLRLLPPPYFRYSRPMKWFIPTLIAALAFTLGLARWRIYLERC